ncbi:MAG: pyridoxal phosphate-dependent aminotransferase, partial [Deltaproteobacteria bacterium]|nr:pyridoxal phosphate-dependent aminotransferase [Deltaproteobacteria bacterium]
MISRRMDGIRSFIVMDILEEALELEARGRRIVHLEVGEPDHRLPPPVEEAALRALRDGRTHYTHSLGI